MVTAPKKFVPGSFVRIALEDGSFGYARLREFPYAVFYDLRTDKPLSDIEAIAKHSVIFTLAVHKSVLGEWEIIGSKPLEDALKRPIEQFMQDIADPSRCTIVDTAGNERPATPQECAGFERVAVWEPKHVQDRLLDHFMNRPNVWTENLKPKI
jgi:Immunity protein 26